MKILPIIQQKHTTLAELKVGDTFRHLTVSVIDGDVLSSTPDPSVYIITDGTDESSLRQFVNINSGRLVVLQKDYPVMRCDFDGTIIYANDKQILAGVHPGEVFQLVGRNADSTVYIKTNNNTGGNLCDIVSLSTGEVMSYNAIALVRVIPLVGRVEIEEDEEHDNERN